MGSGMSLFFVCILIFFGILFGLKTYIRFYPAKFLAHQDIAEAVTFFLGILLGGGILFAFHPNLSLFVWIIGGLCAFVLTFSSFSKKGKIFLSLLLCWGMVWNLDPSTGPLTFKMLLSTALWWGGWHLFAWFDRFPLTSLVVSLGWMLAFVSVGVLMRFMPVGCIVQVGLLGTATMALMYFKFSERKPFLGRMSSSLAGFLWMGVWGLFMVQGALVQTITAWGYYLFEIAVLGMALIRHRPLQTYLGRLLEQPALASKAFSAVFSHVLILSFLSAMTMHMMGSRIFLIFILLVVLIDLYFRLHVLENPQPTWRELLKNTKTTLISCGSEFKRNFLHHENKPVRKKPQKRKKKK